MSTSRIWYGIGRVFTRLKRCRGIEAAPGTRNPEQMLLLAIAHLEYLGYEVGPPQPDGWSYARHPQRYDFHLRALPWGIRLHCAVPLGASVTNSRDAWLAYLNTANENGRFTQFSLTEIRSGVHGTRMRAFASGPYDRNAFAMVMDMWHDDLDWIRRKPDVPTSEDAGARRATSVTIN
jgi:hypothetical protein